MKFFVNLYSKIRTFGSSKKNIVVLLGSNGTFIAVFVHNALKASTFISASNEENIALYKEFLDKFKNFRIFFLLDGPECKMRHDLIPTLQSLVKTNPVEKFIDEFFDRDDIVAYHVYDIVTKPNETWNSLISSTPYQSPVKELLEYTITHKSLKWGGVYFLDLEFSTIINKTHTQITGESYSDSFQICVFILQASGIKLVVKHRNNILAIHNFEYPLDKSDNYIQGIIEQEVHECLLAYRNYINNANLEVSIIIFTVKPELQHLLQQLSFDNHHVSFVSAGDALDPLLVINENFSDSILSALFIKYKSFPAFNHYLKTVRKLSGIKSLLLTALLTIIIMLVSTACLIKYKTFQTYQNLLSLNSKYYEMAQEYDSIKRQYPYIQNATSLVDLYVLEKLLHESTPAPFRVLEEFIQNLDPAFTLDEITWQMPDADHLLLVSEQYVKIDILLKFISTNSSLDETLNSLNEHIGKLRNIFPDLNITSVIFNEKIINLHADHLSTSDKIIIPLYIAIINNK